jgi:hypothetical protein
MQLANQFYIIVQAVLCEPLLIALGLIVGLGYLWRARHTPFIPVSPWIYNITAISLLFLFVPFYIIIWEAGDDLDYTQLVAMSRIIFFSLLLSGLLSHINVYRKHKRVK